MPRNGSGNYSLPPVYLATPGTTVRSEQHNVPLQDIQQALTDSVPRNGSAPMTGNLPMGGRRVTGLGAPTAPTDAATKGYVDGRAITGTQVTMPRDGLVGKPTTGAGPSQVVVLGNGLEFNGGLIRATLGAGLSFVSAAIAATVARFATQAEATAATNNDAAMTPLRTQQHTEATALGWGQTYKYVTGSRVAGTQYQNTTGRPIFISVTADAFGGFRYLQARIAGGDWINVGNFIESGTLYATAQAIIPDRHFYRAEGTMDISSWVELS